MVCGCSGRDNNVISSEKSHIAHIQFAYGLFSQCSFCGKSGIFSDPLYMGKNNFVGSNEHNPWVSYKKLHLKMPGVYQLQISPPPSFSKRIQTCGIVEAALSDGTLYVLV